jgi:hypothetical protein
MSCSSAPSPNVECAACDHESQSGHEKWRNRLDGELDAEIC